MERRRVWVSEMVFFLSLAGIGSGTGSLVGAGVAELGDGGPEGEVGFWEGWETRCAHSDGREREGLTEDEFLRRCEHVKGEGDLVLVVLLL